MGLFSKKVGKEYELGKTIGKGHFSKVKFAVHTKTKEKVAIKVMERKALQSENMEEQVKREIAIMQQLDHPNIVRLHKVYTTKKHVYLVLELVQGGELFDQIVAEKRFQEEKARSYFQQLILGMYYCHVHGIAHRDLKPENLMLDTNGDLKISDFGLSNLQNTTKSGRISADLQLHTMCGTPEYVAPEVLMGKGYSGFTADLWSCGVILYVMLCGSLPFRETEGSSIFSKIKNANYEMKAYLSDSAKDLIRHLLVVDPKQRYSLDEIISHPWFGHAFDKTALELIKAKALPPPTDDAIAAAFTEMEEDAMDADSAPTYNSSEPVEMLESLLHHSSFHDSDFVEKHTAFAMPGPPEDVTNAVKDVLLQLSAHPNIAKDNSFRIKGSVDVPGSVLTYTINFFEKEHNTVLEVKRGRGSTLDFHDFYRRLLDALNKCPKTTPTPHSPGGATVTCTSSASTKSVEGAATVQ